MTKSPNTNDHASTSQSAETTTAVRRINASLPIAILEALESAAKDCGMTTTDLLRMGACMVLDAYEHIPEGGSIFIVDKEGCVVAAMDGSIRFSRKSPAKEPPFRFGLKVSSVSALLEQE